jgi:hypothetical protein
MAHAKAPTKRPARGAAPHAATGYGRGEVQSGWRRGMTSVTRANSHRGRPGFWGSSQSRESHGRLEAKLDRLLLDRGIDPVEISEVANRTV